MGGRYNRGGDKKNPMNDKWLLCDFHIHGNMSDGVLPLNEIVDLYGEKGFDVISITDHVLDRVSLKEEKQKGEPCYQVEKEKFGEYLKLLWREKARAWKECNLLLIPGAELTNNWKKYHILAVDIKEWIDPTLPVEEIVDCIHSQNAIAIACHPHHKPNEGSQPHIHLWRNQKKYRDIFDAWEIANRDDLFNVIGLKRFNYVANSDFHELRPLYSWKSLILAEKNEEAIKDAIRSNRYVAVYLFREDKETL